ncbi:thiol reductase thioredoxin [Streptomyces sp. CS227]|uniref:thioredoxin family protein n=1 Tax=Streptomyces sp. CS227 TaxID=1982763 RepID=UPI000B40D04E|nr:thioredoxin family protein [Streptomyces sp. CS227]OWA19210.1 thiol reductase thioredoxin [Streptomyces sp. CS227]
MADGREAATGGTTGDGGGTPLQVGEMPLQVLDAGRLGTELGERATLVQFSTAFCQPCRATRRVLDDVAALVPGVRHVEIDAEAHLDLVRAVGVERTPTVLILDGRGRVALRATGAPRKADVLAGLARAL